MLVLEPAVEPFNVSAPELSFFFYSCRTSVARIVFAFVLPQEGRQGAGIKVFV